MAEVSIIVPIYNSEKNIKSCVDSILNQSFEDFELILVNDGSKDKSGEICKEYAGQDDRIVLIEQENAGVSVARNRGIENATGKYLLFVDSDDIIPFDYVKNMLTAKKKLGDSYFILSAMKIVSPNNSVPEQTLVCGKDNIKYIDREDIVEVFKGYLFNSPCNKLFERKVIINNSIRMKTGMSIAEDLYFNIQYWKSACFDKVAILNDNFYMYIRTGEESLDNKYNSTYYEDHALAYSELERCCKSFGVSEEECEFILRRYYSIIERSLDNTLHNDCELKWWQKCRKNDIILKDDLFVRALQIRKSELSKGRYLAYQSKCFVLVWAYNKWSEFRNRNK